jgi:hypothetical protein
MYGDFRKPVYIAQYVAESAEIFYILLILDVIPQVMPRQNTKHYKLSTNKQMILVPENRVSQVTFNQQFFFNRESRVEDAFGIFRWEIRRISSRTPVSSPSNITGRVR